MEIKNCLCFTNAQDCNEAQMIRRLDKETTIVARAYKTGYSLLSLCVSPTANSTTRCRLPTAVVIALS